MRYNTLAFEISDSPEDNTWAIKFVLEAIFSSDYYFDSFFLVLIDDSSLGGLSGESGWELERRDSNTPADEPGYEDWPPHADFHASVDMEMEDDPLTIENTYLTRAELYEYTNKIMKAYLERYPSEKKRLQPMMDFIQSGRITPEPGKEPPQRRSWTDPDGVKRDAISYRYQAFGSFDPQEDTDAAIKFVLSFIFANDYFMNFLRVLDSNSRLPGYGVGSDWSFERKKNDSAISAFDYIAWPPNVEFYAIVNKKACPLKYPSMYLTQAELYEYIDKIMKVYLENNPTKRRFVQPIIDFMQSGEITSEAGNKACDTM